MLSLILCHCSSLSDGARMCRSSSSSHTLRNYSELWRNLSRLSSTVLSKAVYWWKESLRVETEISNSVAGVISDTQKWPSVFTATHFPATFVAHLSVCVCARVSKQLSRRHICSDNTDHTQVSGLERLFTDRLSTGATSDGLQIITPW